MKNQQDKLENILKQGPNMVILLVSLCSELEGLYGDFSIKFVDENTNKNGNIVIGWDTKKQSIKLNPNLTNFQIILDLISILCDAINPNHNLVMLENFENGEDYATKKIQVQYQSFQKSNEIIYNYIANNIEEANKIFETNNQQLGQLTCQLIEYHNMSFGEYNSRPDINQYFSNQWSDYVTDLVGQTTSENGNDSIEF